MRDLADLLDPDLHLPIGGRDYRVRCSARQGLHLTRMFGDNLRLDDAQERDEIVRMLGGTYRQLVADKVPWAQIVVAGRAAMFWFGHSPELGEKVWASGGTPGKPAPPTKRRRRRRGNATARANAADTTHAYPAPTDPTTPAADPTTPRPGSVTGT